MTDSDHTPSPTHCISCGSEVPDHAKFCHACGSAVYRPEDKSQPPKPAPVESPVPVPEASTDPTSEVTPVKVEQGIADSEALENCINCGAELTTDRWCHECGSAVYRPNDEPVVPTVKSVPLTPVTDLSSFLNRGADWVTRMIPPPTPKAATEPTGDGTPEPTESVSSVSEANVEPNRKWSAPVMKCGSDGVWVAVGSGGTSRDEILQRLEEYVGSNWKSHYQEAFSRLLDKKFNGGSAGLTWNWSAALFNVLWCLERRLWGWFFVGMFIVAIPSISYTADIEIPVFYLQVFYLGYFIFWGLLGDRAFFNKAFNVLLDD